MRVREKEAPKVDRTVILGRTMLAQTTDGQLCSSHGDFMPKS